MIANDLGHKKNYAIESINSILGEEEFCFGNPRALFGKGGGNSGGGGTTNTVTTSNPPPQVLAAYQAAQDKAQQAASAPLQQYPGQIVAGFSPDQLAAFQSVRNSQGIAAPYLDKAQGAIQDSTQDLWSGIPQFSAENVRQYESPYTQDVVKATQDQFANQNAIQQNNVVGNAIASGAWGGDRSAVAQGIVAGQQALAQAPVIAGLENAGYTQALNEFNNQQQAKLGANQANSWLDSQAGFGYGNLANAAQQSALVGANAQLASGNMQQQQQQSELNVPYEQFLQRQAYPFQTSQFLTNTAEGLGAGQGGTSNAATTQPGANVGSQIGGGLLGTAALIGATGGFGATGWLSSLIPSDRRIKENIHKIGEYKQYPLYTYNYKGNKTPQMGVMAQDVEKIKPSAVGEKDGVKYVNYRKLNTGGRLPQYAPGGAISDIPDLSRSYIPVSSPNVQSTLPHAVNPTQPSSDGSMPKIADIKNLSELLRTIFKKSDGEPEDSSGSGSAWGSGVDHGMSISPIASRSKSLNDFVGNIGNAGFGSFLAKPHKDGGLVQDDGRSASVAGLTPSSRTMNPIVQQRSSQYNEMPIEKLHELAVRIPPDSSQGELIRNAIQQKQLQSSQAQPAQDLSGLSNAPALPSPDIPLYGGYAKGGRPGYEMGGDIEEADLEDPSLQKFAEEVSPAIATAQNDVASDVANEPVAGLSGVSSGEGSQSVKPDLWEALASAGFGIMAGDSPQAGVNIGRGLMYGLKDVQEQRKQLANQQYHKGTLDIEAKKLEHEAAQLAETTNYHNKELGLRDKQISQDAYTLVPDQMGGFVKYNKKTGETTAIPSPGGNGDAQVIDPKTGYPLTGEAYLKTLSPTRAAELKALDEGRMNYPTSVAQSKPYYQQLMNQLYQYNPEASQQTATAVRAFNTGKHGDTVRSLNVATAHLDTLQKLGEALNNKDIKAINAIGNELHTQFGDDAKSNFDLAKQIVGDEVVKSVLGAGAGGVNDRENFQKQFESASSPKQLLGVISTAKHLMGGQIDGLRQQYVTSTGRKDFDRMLTPQARAALLPASEDKKSEGKSGTTSYSHLWGQ